MKIIQTNKFREHMAVHRSSFIVPYQDLISYCQKNNLFNYLTNSFETRTVEFPFPIGYCELVETSASDKIIYAKRINRKIHTRFVLNREPKLVNTCVFCLKRSYTNLDFRIITMFPGFISYKEPEDPTIKSITELEGTLIFWKNHALIYNEKIIDKQTVREFCPYQTLKIS